MTLAANISRGAPEQIAPQILPILKWDKLSDDHKGDYSRRLQSLLDAQPAVQDECRKQCLCKTATCHAAIQNEYDVLVGCMKDADAPLPRFRPGVEKDWWTANLTELRNKSIEIHTVWVNEGRPRQGLSNEERLRVRAAYKRAIRAAQRAPKQATWNKLHSALNANNTDTFWKSWKKIYNKNKSHLAPVVDGCSSHEAIADKFKESFKQNSTPNNTDRVNNLNNKFSAMYTDYVANHNESCNCKPFYISLSNVMDAVLGMKKGKCADEDSISAEHFLNAPLNLLIRLTNLFNAMLKHSFVPSQFRFGCMVPIVKDRLGNQADVNNYRGITISPIGSKLFEHVLKIVFYDYLVTSEHQFGFKKRSSTVHALHCLKETVNYFLNNGSRVFCTFLDASKAFDRLVHSGLFIKLMERNIPLVFLEIIISWYSGLKCRVKWGTSYSDWFEITAGVRQGGILSPDFYCIYVNDLLLKLKSMNKGCYMYGVFAAALFYADDMAILAPSIKGLAALLAACGEYCLEWDICLNAKKSRNLYFGKRTTITHDITINDRAIQWVDEWVYLGITLKSGKEFSCSITDRLKKFYGCLNSILRIDGHSDKWVMLRLIETHCVPVLTYAIEVVHVTNVDERRQLRVAYNSVFRKLFNYRWRDSVTALQHSMERPTWEELVAKRHSNFVDRVRECDRDSLARLCLT